MTLCRYFFLISILRKPWTVGGIFSWKMPQGNPPFWFSGQFVGSGGRR